MSSRSVMSRHRERSLSVESRNHKDCNRHSSRSRSLFKDTTSTKEMKCKEKKRKKSKKKKKQRESSSSSSSSENSDAEELRLLQRLEAERQRLHEEKKKQKEQIKANETPEEKRARRLREKQEKERKRRERMGWDNEYQCYTDQDNPFGDAALTDTFVWTKKLAKQGVTSVSHSELEALNRQKQLDNKIELEKVKQRRLEREAERAEREAEAAAAARAREALHYCCWTRHEDAFHLQQARLRTQIRIRDGRAKPIDLLAWYVSAEECVDALEMHEPYTYLNGLQLPDLEDLLEDINVYKELESAEKQSYWEDVQSIVKDEIGKLRRAALRSGVHSAVAADVTQILKGKSGAQLEALQQQIQDKLRDNHAGLDVGYWESLLSQLRAYRARARLRERHQHNLRNKLRMLKLQQGVHNTSEMKSEPEPSTSSAQQPAASPAAAEQAAAAEEAVEAEEAAEAAAEAEEAAEAAAEQLYAAGGYSPRLLAAAALEPATLVTDAQQDRQRLAYLRAQLHAAQAPAAAAAAAAGASAAALEAATRALLGAAADSAGFTAELALEPPAAAPLWADKYRPRKPRYFNRVHTGFEWNKYNQTHYDMDNPPPKIVQGYKFNIFYPDLIEPSNTPHFSLKPCEDNPEFAVLRFHAGPPYEDIAFKIVNREWEYSYKRGFRCHFHNNIFQLWFHFKRYRYRR